MGRRAGGRGNLQAPLVGQGNKGKNLPPLLPCVMDLLVSQAHVLLVAYLCRIPQPSILSIFIHKTFVRYVYRLYIVQE